jgi:anaerobic ribonucleoside-triphosphate reductase
MGITIGALIMRKISAAARKLTPRGIAQSFGGGLADLSDSVRDFTAEVRDAMREREAQLRAGTGLDGTLGRVPAERAS